LLGLLFNHEDGGDMFLLSVRWLSMVYKVLISQEEELFIVSAMRTSNPTFTLCAAPNSIDFCYVKDETPNLIILSAIYVILNLHENVSYNICRYIYDYFLCQISHNSHIIILKLGGREGEKKGLNKTSLYLKTETKPTSNMAGISFI
jgi:hypothetical protein